MKPPNDRSRRSFLKTSSMLGLAAALRPVTIAEAFADSESKTPIGTEAAKRSSKYSTDGNAIRPFQIKFPEAELADLRRRVNATRWPERETVTDASQGVQLATMQKLARYWGTEYDWRKCEAKINAVPNFITEIDGLDIHFIHVRSRHENALPMIVTHGWPGSIIEQMKIIEPLTNPTAHGGTAADAFHLVIPSLPGYGFSGKPTKPGWNPVSIAKAWATLMQRLGYTKYVAQGGDWGNAVSEGSDPARRRTSRRRRISCAHHDQHSLHGRDLRHRRRPAVRRRVTKEASMFMLSAEDYDAELAERYGWINRASSAGELGDFVRSLAHRIANFPTAGHAVKERVNAIALPTAEDIRRDSDLFIEVWPLQNTEERMQAVMKRGFQTREQKLTWAGWLAT